MPWKESHVVELRTEFVMRAMKGELPFVSLCEEYKSQHEDGL